MILTLNEINYISEPLIIQSPKPLDQSPYNITYGNFSLQVYTNYTYVDVPIKESEVYLTPDSIVITTTLQPYKIYSLSAFAIIAADGEFLSKQTFRFLTTIDPTSSFLNNTNNVYTQLKNIDNILSVEYLLKNQQDYSFQFNPTEYNTETKKYDIYDEDVKINNKDIIIETLINQYFTEYKTFYETINSVVDTTIYDKEYISNLHLVFMKHIVKWSALKGNKLYIELMFSLYAKYMGFNVLSIVEDPVQNFVYRISSSLSTVVWENQIKPYVHPLSWNAIYNEISIDTSSPYYQLVDLKKLIKETWQNDCISFLDAQNYYKKPYIHYIKLRNIYHASGNIEPYNLTKIGSSYQYIDENVQFENIRDEFKFGINFTGYKSEIDYQKNELFSELKELSNIRFDMNRLTKTLTVDFGLTGVANNYIYEVYNKNTIRTISESLLSKVVIPLVDFDDIVVLKLKKNDWEQYINRIDNLPFIQEKTIELSGISNNVKNKYINIRNSNTKAYQYNSIPVINFTSEANDPSLSFINDFDYLFDDPMYTSSFINEFDTGVTFGISSTMFNSSGKLYKNTKFTYPKAGIVTKYEWKLYVNNIIRETKISYFNEVNFVIKDEDYTSAKVGLIIHYKNGFYELNNQAICI